MQSTATFWLQILMCFHVYICVEKIVKRKLKRKKLTHVLTIGWDLPLNETDNIRMWTDPNSLYRNYLILINRASAQIFICLFRCCADQIVLLISYKKPFASQRLLLNRFFSLKWHLGGRRTRIEQIGWFQAIGHLPLGLSAEEIQWGVKSWLGV